jgi:hypothetical protein
LNEERAEVQDPRFSDDVFGLVVNGLSDADAERVRRLLNENGAAEVTGMEDGNG